MVCIYCSAETQVVNSRPAKRLNKVWRRRKCLNCHAVFTSTEAPAFTDSLVVRSHGILAPFSRDKLFLSIFKSLQHRVTAVDDAGALTDTVISFLPPLMQDAVLNRERLSKTVQEVLRRFDDAAAVHYAAFHKK